MGRKNKSNNVDDPQDEGGATEQPEQPSSKNEAREEEKNGASQDGKCILMSGAESKGTDSVPHFVIFAWISY
jgi:hypothetical protein